MRRVVARELRLGDPLELELHLVIARAGSACRRRVRCWSRAAGAAWPARRRRRREHQRRRPRDDTEVLMRESSSSSRPRGARLLRRRRSAPADPAESVDAVARAAAAVRATPPGRRPRGVPRHHDPLDDATDDEVEPDPERAGEHDRRPRVRIVERARLGSRCRCPSASRGPPKYSPTTAPMTLSVAAMRERREEVRQRVRDPQLAQDLRLGGGVGAHQLQRRRVDLGQAADRVDHHREEVISADDRDPRQRALGPEPVVR